MLGNIPDITHSLVGGGTANLATAKILGEDLAARVIAIAKAYLHATLGNGGSAAKILESAANNMAGKR
jgi:hypothetical protein